MGTSFLVDQALDVARRALDGLSLRQQVISRNLANVDTPGYQAQQVDFESALKRALNKTKSLPLTTTSHTHLASPTSSIGYQVSARPGGSFRADQNNVDIDVELTEMSEAGIAYQAITQSVSKKLQLLKTIANSR
ncbi:flagellar basal-body rod protein FlgB [Anaerolinea thermolimosa]|uniref:flagellar basal body rod protein FlgB n=1 Tax=Anaerolinea thermolimosa TaxID=229919 RepID=UPI0007826BD1|nr:flagellar basal body rod protein FlgB [Anaerolinea thermolimosa]GAP07867.1 flagellar basal-body rod protein FlgB [Anaerolinea thermolimosa]